jgi:hypothetical protein
MGPVESRGRSKPLRRTNRLPRARNRHEPFGSLQGADLIERLMGPLHRMYDSSALSQQQAHTRGAVFRRGVLVAFKPRTSRMRH